MSPVPATMLFGIIGCYSAASACAQENGASSDSRGKTSAEILRSYGIELSEPALLAALSSANPKVRVLAAHQLESDNDSDAIPAIEHALSLEKDPLSRVGIATALAAMRDPTGSEHLQGMCSDPNLTIRVVLEAVQMLQLLNVPTEGWANAILKSLSSPGDRDYRDATLSLLQTMYREAQSDQATKIVNVAENLLNDKTEQPSVLMAAGQALAEIGLPSSATVVRGAILAEKDPVVRASLERDLATLEKQPLAHAVPK